jgi:glycosyltransferase involved in cell wall biosynthesis
MSFDKRVLYLQYANPGAYPPIQNSARILAHAGAKVLLLGIITAGTEALRFPTHENIAVRTMKSCRPGVWQKIHYFRFCVWVMWATLSWKPKWVYASDALASPIAWFLTFWPGLKVIYHEHDTPAEANPGNSVTSLFMRVALWARQRLARRAEFCVLPNPKRAEYLKRQTQTNKPIYWVWNCPLRTEAPAVLSQISSDKLIVFYHGSIVPDRLSLNVIRALAELPNAVHLEFAGYETIGHEGYIGEILAEAERIGVSDRVKFIGALSRAELLPRCARAHVGLCLLPADSEDLSTTTMVGASNKPFDYMLCGLALLVSDLPEWKEMFVQAHYGLACDSRDPNNIAKALQWFLDHPEERQRMGTEGRKRVLSDWNYETQFASVVHRILGYSY